MFIFEFLKNKIFISLFFLCLFSEYSHALTKKEEALTTLGLSETATIEQISKVYRKLALKYHPDLNKENQASQAIMQKINEARDYLLRNPMEETFDPEGFTELFARFEKKRAAFNRAQNFEYAGQVFAFIGIPILFTSIQKIFEEYYAEENKDKTWKEIFTITRSIPLMIGTLSTIAGILCMCKAHLIEKTAR